MNRYLLIWLGVFGCSIIFMSGVYAQPDSLQLQRDSLNFVAAVDSAAMADSLALVEMHHRLAELEAQRQVEALEKAALKVRLDALSTTDNMKKEELLQQLKSIEDNEKQRRITQKARIDSLRTIVSGYPVVGLLQDTLFFIYNKVGAFTPAQRAANISRKIREITDNDVFFAEELKVTSSAGTYDVVYGETIIVSISEIDALWYDSTPEKYSNTLMPLIRHSIVTAREETSMTKLMLRIGIMLLVLILAWLVIWTIGKGYVRLLKFITAKSEVWLKDLRYRDYVFLTTEHALKGILMLVRFSRWVVYALLIYITLPIIFSIFPFSRDWADALFRLIWSPFKGILLAIWHYLPNLFSILVIYFLMKYFIRFVKYIFIEIRSGKLRISGFHADWAMPTYAIVRFLLYAFMFVMIFRYLPGSDSDVFQGVSVFIGILFSLGSTSAIANMVAGLVITYMRPFKMGDFIMIGQVKGHVLEKTLLVTRLRTVKNEVVTIPNSAVLTGNTVNYSTESAVQGLIINTTVTIGYEVPWKGVHEALIEAAMRTELLEKEPVPFVWQTSLDDFYVAYQINAYTKHAGKQGRIYSELHQNIQDVFKASGIEIMSPHYRANRDGNATTVPPDPTPSTFNPSIDKNKE
ncbi:mechanosensitive ion channel domain-containing protein [Geofilum sp. OHC36d9]|uniref:mechanosensitive ion channel domain-containing protein n=1 Tax=Geofilum sp. OHC36d9 TaxID=3458413 RepID=UPI004033AEB6